MNSSSSWVAPRACIFSVMISSPPSSSRNSTLRPSRSSFAAQNSASVVLPQSGAPAMECSPPAYRSPSQSSSGGCTPLLDVSARETVRYGLTLPPVTLLFSFASSRAVSKNAPLTPQLGHHPAGPSGIEVCPLDSGEQSQRMPPSSRRMSSCALRLLIRCPDHDYHLTSRNNMITGNEFQAPHYLVIIVGPHSRVGEPVESRLGTVEQHIRGIPPLLRRGIID